jgi:hypothetical protein
MKPSADVEVAWMTTVEPTGTRLPGAPMVTVPPASGLTMTVPVAK